MPGVEYAWWECVYQNTDALPNVQV